MTWRTHPDYSRGPCLQGMVWGWMTDKETISCNFRRSGVKSLGQVWTTWWFYSSLEAHWRKVLSSWSRKWNFWLAWRPNIPVRLDNRLIEGVSSGRKIYTKPDWRDRKNNYTFREVMYFSFPESTALWSHFQSHRLAEIPFLSRLSLPLDFVVSKAPLLPCAWLQCHLHSLAQPFLFLLTNSPLRTCSSFCLSCPKFLFSTWIKLFWVPH